MTWDKSSQNPTNLDPSKQIRWRRQSWNELLFGTPSFRYLTRQPRDQRVYRAAWLADALINPALFQ